MITSEFWPLDVFRSGVTKYVKFGADWTMHV